jgi:hypothetical protein
MSHAPDTRVRSSRQSGSRLVTVLRRMRWPVVIAWLSPAGFPPTGPGRWPGPRLDGSRLTGSHLPIPDDASAGGGP